MQYCCQYNYRRWRHMQGIFCQFETGSARIRLLDSTCTGGLVLLQLMPSEHYLVIEPLYRPKSYMRQISSLTYTCHITIRLPICECPRRGASRSCYKIYLPDYHRSGLMSLLCVKFAKLLSRLSCMMANTVLNRSVTVIWLRLQGAYDCRPASLGH